MAIVRTNRLPLYLQLKEWLISQIEEGNFAAGNQIPAEATLMQQFSLSRGTVRQALNELVHEGCLYRLHGKGTFVSAPRVEHRMAQVLMSLAEDMDEQGIPFSSKVLSQSIIVAGDGLASRLHIAPKDKVIFLERLGYAKGEPIVVGNTYVPAFLCPNLINEDLTNCSLYKLLEAKYSIKARTARRTLEPALADEHEARLLAIKKGSPIHLMETVAYDESEQPVEYSKLRFRGDRSRFVFKVTRQSLTWSSGNP